MIRILHTADWQIGRTPAGFEPDDAAALSEARFQAVERLAALAAAERADAVLVAGDVFDAQTVADKTVRRLFNALAAFPGPWLLLPGNHDAALAESVWTRALRLGAVPPNARPCLDARPQPLPGAVVLPAPLVQRHTQADLTAGWSAVATPEGLPRIGLAHGSVQGVLPEAADSANPIAAGRAAEARLDYLALGDWHGTKRIDERCWYAGTPETDRFRANDSGQALWVRIDGPGAPPQVEPVAVGAYRWQQLERRLDVESDLGELERELAALGPRDVVRLALAGACGLAAHRQALAAVDAARARARALVLDADALRLSPSDADLDALHADGYVGETLQILREQQRADDPAAAGRARDALLILARHLDAARAAAAA
jgi:DNA repair exonuclease SbcCD nuclease subunit